MVRRSVLATDESTRDRVIRAAIDCVLEDGYYRASSNRIARRAGLTWGVIQHHFGTRDQLLIEVMRSIVDRQIAQFKEAVIEGDTVHERLTSYSALMWQHFGTPEYLVSSQILLNLSRDPVAAAETADTLVELSERLTSSMHPLLEAAVGARVARSALGRTVGESLRGLAIGQSLSAAFSQKTITGTHVAREGLVRALADLIESGARSDEGG